MSGEYSEELRAAGHVWLDLVSSYDHAEPAKWPTAFSAALPRFSEVGALTAEFDDETDTVNMEGSGLFGAGALIIHCLAMLAAQFRGTDRDEILIWMREELDS